MGASWWSYVTRYHGDVAAALRELQERVFDEGDYYWWDEFGDYEPRPTSVDQIRTDPERWTSGTHSILDIDRAVDTTDPRNGVSSTDHGTVRPLAAASAARLFGTARPSRAQFEGLAGDHANPRHNEFISEVRARWTGCYVLLYDGDTPAEVGFWGYSGD
jgi:hypothetical protein